MIVVADTSVLLNLGLLGLDLLLTQLFGSVLAPADVQAEFDRLVSVDSRFSGLTFPAFVDVHPTGAIHPLLVGNQRIHVGEVAALSLAVDQHADAVLLDDRAARNAAGLLGLRVIGVVGILLQGKRAGHIEAVAPLLNRLEVQARFWMSRSSAQANPHPCRRRRTGELK